MKKFRLGLVSAALLVLAAIPLMGAGWYEGLTSASVPLTGNERFAVDTLLSGGRSPQTEAVTVDQVKQYVFGNGGTANVTGPNTASCNTVASSGAATNNCGTGIVTTEALTTAAVGFYTLALSNTTLTASSVVLAMVANGTNTIEGPVVTRANPGAGNATLKVKNTNAVSALNGTLQIRFAVIN